MSVDLPEGWAMAKLGELCEHPQYGWTTSAKKASAGLHQLRTTDISGGGINWETVPFCDEEPDRPEKYLLRKGDIVVSRAGSVGISHLMDECRRAVFASYLIRLRALPPSPPEFLRIFLRSPAYWAAVADHTAGIAVQNINATKLRELDLALPPLAEQKRIVAKVEALLARVNACRQRLAKVPGILKRFRQSVLAAACSGHLTVDWRERRSTDVGSIADQELDGMPEIPIAWRYERASEVVEPGTVISYGIVLPGPKRCAGIPYVRGQDIDDSGRILVDQLWRTTPEIASKHKRSELRNGDVLLCVIRHLRVAVVPDGLNGANLTQGTVRLRPSKKILANYLARYLGSAQAQGWMKARYIGMSMPRINVEHARDIPIALPPLDEQHEIVRRVDALFRLADAIEKRVAAATARAEKLTQAILAKAFRGELVPTEAELARAEGRAYEPASVLLERIRAERAETDDRPRRRTGKGNPRRPQRRQGHPL